MVESHIEALIDLLQSLFRKFQAARPDREIFGVALLKFDQFRATLLADAVVGFRCIAGMAVEAQQLREGIREQGVFIEDVFPRPGDHAKLRAPVADVVVGDHLVT